MQENLYHVINKILTESYSSSLVSGHNFFDIVIEKLEAYHNKPCHSLQELRVINTKERGTLFECFCVRYLQRVKGIDAWLLVDTPEEILQYLNLRKKDIGIDIVGYNKEKNLYYAVQAKYKGFKKTYKGKKSVSWKELSTFYSLCERTGPWEKHIVMSNADYIRHMGYKKEKDLSICYQTFMGIKRDKQVLFVGEQKQHTLSDNATTTESPTVEQLRELRLKKLQK